MSAAKKQHRGHGARHGATVTAEPLPADAEVVVARQASPLMLSLRLMLALKQAERDRNGPMAEALNAVIVALSDARQKAVQGRGVIELQEASVLALLDEVSAL
jgi:hypothetical protein